MKLKKLIPEKLQSNHSISKKEMLIWLEECSRMCSKLGSRKIIWRGFRGSLGGFNKITDLQGRENYRGGIPSAKKIIQFLNKKFGTKGMPTFTSFEKKKAAFWGAPYIFIPTSPFTVVQNKEVDDLLVYSNDVAKETGSEPIEDHVADWIANNYKKTLSQVNAHEALFFVNSYYLLALDNWLFTWFPRKWRKNVSTYKDLKDLFDKWIWLHKKEHNL